MSTQYVKCNFCSYFKTYLLLKKIFLEAFITSKRERFVCGCYTVVAFIINLRLMRFVSETKRRRCD